MTVVHQISDTEWLEEVDPSMQAWMNRFVDPKTIERYIKKEGGWNPSLGSVIDVAELPDGRRFRWDGSHRCEIFKKTHPAGSRILAKVTKVESESQISDLYVSKNKTSSKQLSQEDIFVHNYRNEPEVVDALRASDLCVSNNVNAVGAVGAPSVKVNGFRSALKKVGQNNLMHASEVVQNAIPDLRQIPVELLTGVAIAIDRAGLTSKANKKKLERFLRTLHSLHNEKVNVMARELKKAGGAVNSWGSECVALGLLKKYQSSGAPGLRNVIKGLSTTITMKL